MTDQDQETIIRQEAEAPAAASAEAVTEADQQQKDLDDIMRKYDRESNTRIWEGVPKIIVTVFLALFSLYCIYMTLFSTALPETRLSMFLGFILIAGFLNYPADKKHVRPNSMPWYDVVLMVVGAGCFFYFSINAFELIKLATEIKPLHVVLGVIGILILVELCRRCVGLPILCIAGVLVIYAFANQLSYGGSFYMALRTIVYKLFYTTSGVIGTPTNVCFTYIVLFIIFGAFLERTGIANFFIAFANRIAGWSSGGPAKVAVISSALCGMVSGSSVGNTVTTGSVTIPMMKKTGYKPEFAGAVEAAASTGGQIMPPIMGAAAFLMAEYMAIPYAQVAVKAILPAVLYFTGIFIAVHLEAKKLGLKGISREDLPKWSYLAKNCYLIIPLVLLVWLVASGAKTMAFSAAVSIVAAFFIGFINMLINALIDRAPDEKAGAVIWAVVKKTLASTVDALVAGAKGAITVAVACAMAGIIAGCITVTGLASILINAIVQVAGNATILGLLLTMICCIVLGMGVPTTANYCIMAATCAPILIQLGFPVVAAHFFVFYFGIVADITPPVALAAYAGSAIAKSNPMKTGLNATKLAIAAFIVPFIFAYSPAMLLEGLDLATFTGWLDLILLVLSSLLGLFSVAAALNGFLFKEIPIPLRVLLAAGGLCMMIPGWLTDVIGFAVALLIIVFQYAMFKKTSEAA
ncbi:MAG: TRAP transporter permease [Clostridia bacterium]|nr:TRAP transporter permease [Clostridia bacterium]